MIASRQLCATLATMSSKRTVALATTISVLLLGTTALGDPATAYRRYKGKIVCSETQIPNDLGIESLKTLAKSEITRPSDSEPWSFYFVGFLTRKPEESPIFLVFYSVDKSKQDSYAALQEINVDPSSTIVMANVSLSKEDGLSPGGKYNVFLARRVGGKEIVYAKTQLTFR
ncbi:MAG: hypothetical protein V2A73_17815 [Pseudomonadota bacterium]